MVHVGMGVMGLMVLEMGAEACKFRIPLLFADGPGKIATRRGSTLGLKTRRIRHDQNREGVKKAYEQKATEDVHSQRASAATPKEDREGGTKDGQDTEKDCFHVLSASEQERIVGHREHVPKVFRLLLSGRAVSPSKGDLHHHLAGADRAEHLAPRM